MMTELMPEGETVRVGGYPLTYVRRLAGLLHTFVLDRTDDGQARVRLAVQPVQSSSERLMLSQTMLLNAEQLAELATAAISLQAEITADALTADNQPQPPADNGG